MEALFLCLVSIGRFLCFKYAESRNGDYKKCIQLFEALPQHVALLLTVCQADEGSRLFFAHCHNLLLYFDH